MNTPSDRSGLKQTLARFRPRPFGVGPLCGILSVVFFFCYLFCCDYCTRKDATPSARGMAGSLFPVFPTGYLPDDFEIEIGGVGLNAEGAEVLLGRFLNMAIYGVALFGLAYLLELAIYRRFRIDQA
jgi:hypothetical protein